MTEPAYTALWALTTRSWFGRTWTIQEIVLAGNPVVLCGNCETSWSRFEFALGFFEGSGLLSSMPLTQTNDPKYAVRGLHRRATLSMLHKRLEQGSKLTFYNCVLQSRLADATNPRDKVFAFFGLATDAGSGPDSLSINIDYHLPVEDVYTDFWVSVVTRNRNLNHLGVAVNRIYSAGGQGLPSWVPDWTMPHPEATIMCLDLPQSSVLLHTQFCASGESTYEFRSSAGRKRLIVPAIQIDKIEDLGPICTSHPVDRPEGVDEAQAEFAPPGRRLTRKWIAAAGALSRKTYPFTGEAVMDAYWQTCFGDHALMSYDNARDAFYWFYNLEKWPKFMGHMILAYQYKSMAQGDDNLERRMIARTALNGSQHFRRIGRTTKGYMCQVSSRGRPGDTVFILQGACLPFVLRLKADGWELVSEAYVHGIMRGEAHDESLYELIELV
ncbi:hypothetical protein K458DRAFT_464162 [Lentithecium fluviatile CBS 122367]|uniref:Heterokaryon incompatibility domain-containing protein n=1 Tax=Lentithecium fluviatile CBS 122367 TaxID=1168545 RepID=A0A6G1IJ80_9PLEO|nr:hypothetical protein K458DRAFT_464162 [Lentithecium fluviatile CBS 122367]